jgi:hypothetical protein
MEEYITTEMIESVKKDVVKTFLKFINSLSEEEQYLYLCEVGFKPLNTLSDRNLMELYCQYLKNKERS